MQGDPSLSIKERIAKFQNIINNSNNNAPASKTPPPMAPKNTSPQINQHKIVQPIIPVHLGVKYQGEVQSPNIVSPSITRQTYEGKLLGSQNNQVTNTSSTSYSNTSYQQPPKITVQSGQTIVQVTENGLVDKESLPSLTSLREMMEGRGIGLYKKQETPSPKKIIQTSQEAQKIQRKQSPVVETNTNIGNIKNNAEKLNFFFENKIEKEKIKPQQEVQRQAESGSIIKLEKLPEQTINEVIQSEEINKNNALNINIEVEQQKYKPIQQPWTNRPASVSFSSSLSEPSTASEAPILNIGVEPVQGSQGKEEDLSLVARMKKRKKMTKASFESDDD